MSGQRNVERVYRFIIRYKRMHFGDSPSRDEIAAGAEIVKSHVNVCLAALVADGRVRLPAHNRARAIQIPGSSWHFDEIEHMGKGLPDLEGGGESKDPLLPHYDEKLSQKPA